MSKRTKKEQKKEVGPLEEQRTDQAKGIPGPEINKKDPTVNVAGAEKVKQPRTVDWGEGLVVTENNENVFIDIAPDRILVDRVKFSRMVKAVVQGIQGGKAYSNRAGITKFGEIMGGKNTEEYEALYRACMATVEEDNKR